MKNFKISVHIPLYLKKPYNKKSVYNKLIKTDLYKGYLPKLHEKLKSQMPPPSKGLIGAYKEIIPTIHRQAYDPSYTTPRDIPA